MQVHAVLPVLAVALAQLWGIAVVTYPYLGLHVLREDFQEGWP